MTATERTQPRMFPKSPNSTPSECVIVFGPDPERLGEVFLLDGEHTYLFGRSSSAQIQVNDAYLSRQHFVLTPSTEYDGYMIEDLNTVNGTYVDGERIVGRMPLTGTIISAGDTLFVIDRPPDPDDLPSSPEAKGDAATEVVGTSLTAAALRRSIETVAPHEGSVLLLGETGTGKEVAARAIHRLSGRSGPFVAVNCAAIPTDLAESELFGYAAGAFTGAMSTRAGAVMRSVGGTLFLDEVGELAAPVQAKLLRVLQERQIRPLGADKELDVDIRVVSATLRDPHVSDFRLDLFARLGDWVIRIPPLRDRRRDNLPIWRAQPGGSNDDPTAGSPQFFEALLLHDWPMNVRELIKLHRRLAALGRIDEPELSDLPEPMRTPLENRANTSAAGPRANGGANLSREDIEHALGHARGNVSRAATLLGLKHRNQLYRLMETNKIDPKRFRDDD